MESVFVVTAVVGIVSFLHQLQAKDVWGAITVLCAALIGLLAGVTHVDGLTITTGLIAGLAAVGVHQVAKQVG